MVATIVSPSQYQGKVMGLCADRRGELLDQV